MLSPLCEVKAFLITMCVNEITKKSTLLFICLLACSFLMAQQNQISDLVQIDFPARTVKLSKEELRQTVDKWKRDSITLFRPIETNRDFYSIDSMLLSLHGERFQAPKNYLKERLSVIKAVSTVDGMNYDWTSEIKSYNNYSVFITNIDSKDWGSYFFHSVNRKGSAILNGHLFYLKSNSDKDKALKVLEELLTNIVYKL